MRSTIDPWAYALGVRALASQQGWWGGEVFSMTADDLPPVSIYVVTQRRSMGVMTVLDEDGQFRSFGYKDGKCTGEWK